ncbi:signal transduction histidine kinase (STHK), LytS [Alkalinema sp. FACHB-956]|uniref:signal transduction histidine kinase (STHK), LytS n=1 Tax=Alkalinema sp. FACHB-956 TaxID=2692768 RepID=UPI001682BC42|nr:signal transduction histidine kinase (STHK), LytS [Alkalinema sp. FACHB-956]MBD2327972.1 signal transduction histidine kinase (STHK), LytS [Alkalinema sp. FACHB-956]
MNLNNLNRSVGVFPSAINTENALTELRNAGFAMDRVSVVARNFDRSDDQPLVGETRLQELTETTHVDEGAKAGAATGGTVGGLMGLLVGLGTLAIPGVGPIMLAGAAATTIATTLAGGAIGAATGGLVGGLIGLGIPEERAKVYNDYVNRGQYLVIIDGTDAEIRQAEDILKRRGIQEWSVYPSSKVVTR